MTLQQNLFVFLQYIVPQHLLSRAVGLLAECEIPQLKNLLISQFIRIFHVNMNEAEQPDYRLYRNFNQFFTRPLHATARSVNADSNAVVSPADGAISQIGDIDSDGRILQAKSQQFNVAELLGGDRELAARFMNGSFATIYLSPKDYHRVHIPVSGKLQQMIYVPGDLFSVNVTTSENVPRLFARNERAVCIFETDMGSMAVVLVGAMIVAGIETVWAGQVTPRRRRIEVTHYSQPQQDITLNKGDELGRFKLGSTAIVLFEPGKVAWLDNLQAGTPLRMGEAIGMKK